MLRVLVPFSGGVWAGMHPGTGVELIHVFILLPTFLLLAFVIFKRQRGRTAFLPWFNPLVLFLLLFLAGTGIAIQSRPEDPGLPVDQWVLAKGELCGAPKALIQSHVFEMKVRLICSQDSTYRTRTMLRCSITGLADSLLPAPGEIWQFSGKLASIRNSGNPGMPDYRAIMGRKNCWYRFYISSPGSIKAEQKLSSTRIREVVSEPWQGEERELNLLKAVCLGDRTTLSDDLQESYTTAGGMHLLAVSGLHVGLIWWVLQQLTGWLNLIFRKGKAQSLLVVGILWFYAFVTGFSSSVCRAVTMFSFFSVSRMRGEGKQTLNVILASAFLLLLINPSRMLDVGFQLSYTAITGIVILHPLIAGILRVKQGFLRRLWEAVTVSFAAQLATSPLVIHYFQQIPVYAVITSLIAIPLLSILIFIFVCSVPFMVAGILEGASSFLMILVARIMNHSVEFLASLPGATLTELQLGPFEMLACLLALLLLTIILQVKTSLPRYLLMFLLSFYLSWQSFSAITRFNGSEFILTHVRGASQVSIRHGAHVDHYCWHGDSTSMAYMETYRTRVWSRRIYENQLFEVEHQDLISGGASTCFKLKEGIWLLGTGGLRALVLKGPGYRDLPELLYGDHIPGVSFEPDFILFSGEPALDVFKLIQSFEEVTLVIDGSNPSWYRKRMSAKYDQIYLTELDGAYVKRW